MGPLAELFFLNFKNFSLFFEGMFPKMQNTYTQHENSAIMIHSQRSTYEEKQDPTFIPEDCDSDVWEDAYDEADEGAEQERIKRIIMVCLDL